MTAYQDSALLSFTAEVLERHGGLVERGEDYLLSVLPDGLSAALMLPEESRIGDEHTPLLYGSPLLDRVIGLATTTVPVVYGKIHVPYLKKDGFGQVLEQYPPVLGAKVTLSRRAETLASYMVLVCHYVALSDERKEGLVQVAASEETTAVIPGFEEQRRRFEFSVLQDPGTGTQFAERTENILSRVMKRASAMVEEDLSEFVSGMQRRLERDVRNTQEYYEALALEMEAGLSHPNLTPAQYTEREEKIAGLPAEMNAKVQDLLQKYSVKVSVTGTAALRLLVPVVLVTTQVEYRKQRRPVSFVWNPVTRTLDPRVCEVCGKTISQARPMEHKSGLKLVCPACWTGR
jgi:hypothetical protein